MNASEHLLDRVEKLVRERGPMRAGELASALAEEGHAFAVVMPDSVDGRAAGEELDVSGGQVRALSADALNKRLSRAMSGFERDRDGRWGLRDNEPGAACTAVKRPNDD